LPIPPGRAVLTLHARPPWVLDEHPECFITATPPAGREAAVLELRRFNLLERGSDEPHHRLVNELLTKDEAQRMAAISQLQDLLRRRG
jgi:hypothetical protein